MTIEKLNRLNMLKDRIETLDRIYTQVNEVTIYLPTYRWALLNDEEILDRFRAFIKAELDMAMEEFKNA